MATKTVKMINCDICNSEIKEIPESSKDYHLSQFPIIFSNEQTEGRSCAPYLSFYDIDICTECKNALLKGNMIFGRGVMGYNTYYFKENKQ